MPSRSYSLYNPLLSIGPPDATLTLVDADDSFFEVPDATNNNQTAFLDGSPVTINSISAALGPQLVLAIVDGVEVELSLVPVQVVIESGLIDDTYILYPDLPEGAEIVSVSLPVLFPNEVALPLCFDGDSLVDTALGEVRAAEIQCGDQVRTVDGRLETVRWVGRTEIAFRRRPDMAKHAPIVFEPGSIDGELPTRRLRLSPQHRVLVTGWKAQLHFGEEEVLAPAKALVNDATIYQQHDCPRIEYVHILCNGHELVRAEGAAVETLFLGDVALSEETGPIREELLALFPELEAMAEGMKMARLALKVREARLLADA